MPPTPFFSPVTWLAILLFWIPLASVAETEETGSQSPERIVWRKAPITLPLVVGEERLIHFPDSVSVGLPQSLTPLLRSQSINGTLYLLARQPFDSTRVMVRSQSGGPLYVLDVYAQPQDSDRPPLPNVEVLLETHSAIDNAAPSGHKNGQRSSPLGYVALTRYAAQQLYAPGRLVPSHPGVVAIPVNDESVALVQGGKVDAVPVAAWKAGLHYVTAVKLTNRTSTAVVLDPRELRGAWLAATFQHNRLLRAGSDADTTVVYLVSERPFDVAR